MSFSLLRIGALKCIGFGKYYNIDVTHL